MQPEYCLLDIHTWCMPRSDWAAWVQALGAILAIGAAIYLSRSEVRRTVREHRARVEAWKQLAMDAADNIRHACSQRPGDFEFVFETEHKTRLSMLLERLVQPLLSAPIWEMEDIHLATDISSIQYQVSLATHALVRDDPDALQVVENLQATCEEFLAHCRGTASP